MSTEIVNVGEFQRGLTFSQLKIGDAFRFQTNDPDATLVYWKVGSDRMTGLEVNDELGMCIESRALVGLGARVQPVDVRIEVMVRGDQ